MTVTMQQHATSRVDAGAIEAPATGTPRPAAAGAGERARQAGAAATSPSIVGAGGPGLLDVGIGVGALLVAGAGIGGLAAHLSRGSGGTLARVAIGGAAVVGAALALRACGVGASGPNEFMVSFASKPDLSAARDASDVHRIVQEHYAGVAPAVEAELELLTTEEKVASWEGFPAANGIVVDVVRGHEDEVRTRLADVQGVGEVARADL